MAGLTQFAKPDVPNTGTEGALEMSGSLSHSKSMSHGQSRTMNTSTSGTIGGPSTKLYIRNLPATCGEEDLRILYAPFGPITSILMTTERAGTGFCSYVTFVQHADAHAALKATHGTQHFGSSTGLNVRMAETLESRNNRLSRKAAAQQPGSAQLQPMMGSLTMSGQLAMSGSHNSLAAAPPGMVAQPLVQQPMAIPMQVPQQQMVYVTPQGMMPMGAPQPAPVAMQLPPQAIPAGATPLQTLPAGMVPQPMMTTTAPPPQIFQPQQFVQPQ